jgi:DNA mismatch endonuclease (patch repair protein)
MNKRKAPRYDSFSPASASASRAKRRNRAKNTAVEVLLRKALWRRGVRYRLYVGDLPGKPDVVLLRERIAIFIDGDFWHGRNWEELEKKLRNRANSEYWIAKIQYNRSRDRDQTQSLHDLGWEVLRFWETDIHRDLDHAVDTIMAAINRKTAPGA